MNILVLITCLITVIQENINQLWGCSRPIGLKYSCLLIKQCLNHIHQVVTVNQNRRSQHQNILCFWTDKITELLTMNQTKDTLNSTLKPGTYKFLEEV